MEDGEPVQQCCILVDARERGARQAEHLARRGAEAEQMIEIKIVQCVRADEVFGLLCDLTVGGWEQLGADGRGENIAQAGREVDLFGSLSRVGTEGDDMADQRFGQVGVDGIA